MCFAVLIHLQEQKKGAVGKMIQGKVVTLCIHVIRYGCNNNNWMLIGHNPIVIIRSKNHPRKKKRLAGDAIYVITILSRISVAVMDTVSYIIRIRQFIGSQSSDYLEDEFSTFTSHHT